MRRSVTIIALFTALCSTCIETYALSWDEICSSGAYYYGSGTATTEDEADKIALNSLIQMIAVNVSSDFKMIEEENTRNGNIDSKSLVKNCMSTYSSAMLTNVEHWTEGKAPNVTVRRFMKRSELGKIFENRIAKAKDMISIADEAIGRRKLDMALQYYYWSYCLIRSLQHPMDVKDNKGKSIVTTLPIKMREILDNVDVFIEKKDGDFIDLLITYNGMPITSMDFSYSDGRGECDGTAKDGRGVMEMVQGFSPDVYHLNIEYEYKNMARGDDELMAVMNVIQRNHFQNQKKR